ncbi:MAG: dihydropteroate synthase [Desulfatibacillaceae bacterium]|nr:dihydropteroate synthase [Desulfatibacillaceae bacterium]
MFFIADNLQITRPSVAKAFAGGDAAFFVELARRMERAGANAIDINTGPLPKNPQKAMTFFVDAVQEGCSLPLCLDTVNPFAMEAGLARARHGRPIINGVSLEPSRFKSMAGLARRFDADIIAYLLTPQGRVPSDSDTRLALAANLFAGLCHEGILPERIVIDPICPPLVWDEGHAQARAVVETLRLLPEVLNFPIRTVVGLSNLTSGLRTPRIARTAFQSAYIAMLCQAGLNLALLDIFCTEPLNAARACTALLKPGVFSWEIF